MADIEPLSDDANRAVLNSREKAEKGIFTFDSLYLRLTPETIGLYKIQANSLHESAFPEEFMQFRVSFRRCFRGEIESHNKECHVCGSEVANDTTGWQKTHMYSLSTSDAECSACPSEAYCWGLDKIAPKSGYWRANSNSLQFIKCPNPDACLGATPGNDGHLPSGRCNYDDGYEGPLCTSCRKGFTSGSRSTCSQCPDLAITTLRLIALLLFAFDWFDCKKYVEECLECAWQADVSECLLENFY